jgi:hypothetical protein
MLIGCQGAERTEMDWQPSAMMADASVDTARVTGKPVPIPEEPRPEPSGVPDRPMMLEDSARMIVTGDIKDTVQPPNLDPTPLPVEPRR